MDIIQNLRYTEKKYANKTYDFGELNISNMARDCRREIERLMEANIKLEKFKSFFDELYGKELGVSYWHLNGDIEPFDTFYELAIAEMEVE